MATYPLSASKVPAVSQYMKIGAPHSRQLAMRFPDATAAGFVAGSRNRITVVDIDSTDSRLVDEMHRMFGVTPLRVMTPSGGWHLYYRHNGEKRDTTKKRIADVDILANTNVVAAGSITPKGTYAIERGTLDDLDRLPRMKAAPAPPRKPDKVPNGQRGESLFNYCRSIVGHCDTLDQLTDAARTWVEQRCEQPADDPVTDVDIIKACNSVWAYRGGRKRVMNHIVQAPVYEGLVANLEAMALFAYLSAENGPDAEFMIADGLTEARGWPRRFVPKARKALIKMGIVECVREPKKGTAGLYRWKLPHDE